MSEWESEGTCGPLRASSPCGALVTGEVLTGLRRSGGQRWGLVVIVVGGRNSGWRR